MSMTAFTGCCIVVTFVFSALSILFQLSFGSNKTRVELAKVLAAHLDQYREIRNRLGYACH